MGGAPAPTNLPDSQDSEVQILDDAADLSEGAQAKLLKSLLAEKQQLAQQVASLQKKTGDAKLKAAADKCLEAVVAQFSAVAEEAKL